MQTIKEIQATPFADLPGVASTGSTRSVRYKTLPVEDDYCSEVLAISYDGGKTLHKTIRSCDTGLWTQFIHQGC